RFPKATVMGQPNDDLFPEAADADGRPGSLDLLGMLWRRKSLILLGAVVGLALGWLYYAQLAPTYQASAQLWVKNKRPDALPIGAEDPRFAMVEDYIASHIILIRSQGIIRE